MKSKPRYLAVAAGMIAIAVLIAGAYNWRSRTLSLEQTEYREAHVTRENISATVLATGTVAPENRVEIKTPVAGRVERILVDEGHRVKKGEVLGWMSSTERAALLDAAAGKGANEVARWEELYKPMPILAPITGSIIARNVQSGQTVTPTDAIYVMSDRLIVKAQVDETDLAQVRLHQSAIIVLDAYGDNKIEAEVDRIAFDAKTVSNVTTYSIDVLPKVTPAVMRSGMTANVTFLVAQRDDAISVPTEAIATREGKFFVKVGTASSPSEKMISVGVSDGKRTEILSGLSEGESVLIAKLQKGKDAAASSPLNPFSRGQTLRKANKN